MRKEVRMPDLGSSVKRIRLTRWLKKVGDYIEQGEFFYEISTDKVNAEVPSPETGRIIEQKVEEGEAVVVNCCVAVLRLMDEQGFRSAEAEAQKEKEP